MRVDLAGGDCGRCHGRRGRGDAERKAGQLLKQKAVNGERVAGARRRSKIKIAWCDFDRAAVEPLAEATAAANQGTVAAPGRPRR